jgi:hypothetical protein
MQRKEEEQVDVDEVEGGEVVRQEATEVINRIVIVISSI